MALMQWMKTYNVGIPKFDAQHQGLFDQIRKLQEAMRNRDGKQAVPSIIISLSAYTATHFKDEEMLMKKHNYPEYQKHKAIHNSFLRKVREFEKDAKEGNLTVTLDLNKFLTEWLIQHIMGEDKKMAQYINSLN